MKRAIIIDDEPLARTIILEYLQDYPTIEVLQECNDGFEGLKAIQTHHPDLIFLDIQMPKINGFEMLELIEQPPSIIFTTAFDSYAIKAFDAHAIDYLLKPFSKERFDKALQKWAEQPVNPEKGQNTSALLDTASQLPNQQDRLAVKTGNNIRIIPTHEILYLEADDDYVKIHTQAGVFLKSRTMQHFEDSLDSQQFVRVHRSFIVQIQQITRIDPYQKDTYTAILKTGAKIPVSRTGYAKLKGVLGI